MTVLETERLRVRPLVEADALFILELLNEPAWIQFIGDRGVRTLDDARDYLRSGPRAMYARVGFGLCAVELKDDGTTLGICGLIKRDTMDDVDLGFAYFERHWGRGYAFEAATVVLDHGRKTLRLPRIVALTSPDNARSEKLLRRLGFGYERMIRLAPDKPECRLLVQTL
jgi:RimJ/RimL family protein N-acetyltransferase